MRKETQLVHRTVILKQPLYVEGTREDTNKWLEEGRENTSAWIEA